LNRAAAMPCRTAQSHLERRAERDFWLAWLLDLPADLQRNGPA
jgi:hypothetical protein